MGLFEILIIAVVALLVVGPERMPEAVRGVALTLGRIKRTFNSAREEFEKQIGAEDIRRQLHNETVMANLEKMKQDMAEIGDDIEGSVNKTTSWMDDENTEKKAQKTEALANETPATESDDGSPTIHNKTD